MRILGGIGQYLLAESVTVYQSIGLSLFKCNWNLQNELKEQFCVVLDGTMRCIACCAVVSEKHFFALHSIISIKQLKVKIIMAPVNTCHATSLLSTPNRYSASTSDRWQ